MTSLRNFSIYIGNYNGRGMNSMVKISSQFKMEMKFSDGIAFFFFFYLTRV